MLYENQKINWDELRTGYNRIYKTDYKTVKVFLSDIYKKYQTLIKVGDILGIADTTVMAEMVRQGVPRLPKGHRGPPKGLLAIRKIGDVSGLSAKEIATITGYSRLYTYVMLRKYNIEYRRTK